MKTFLVLLAGFGVAALAACGGSKSSAGLATASPATSAPAPSASAAPSSPSPANPPSPSPAAPVTVATATLPAATATAIPTATVAPPTATSPPATAIEATAIPPTAPPPTPTEASGAPLSASVGIDSTFNQFTPSRAFVAAGGSVSWAWSGDTYHDVTGINFGAHSETAKSGALTVTFATPGTYRYECSVHIANGMRGTVVVQ